MAARKRYRLNGLTWLYLAFGAAMIGVAVWATFADRGVSPFGLALFIPLIGFIITVNIRHGSPFEDDNE